MIASEFEYRNRFWIMGLIFAIAYACYNLDRLNILYSLAAWGGVSDRTGLTLRVLHAAAAMLGGIGAALLTWASAYQLRVDEEAIAPLFGSSIAGPYLHLRNPEYLGYFLLLAGLSTFQSRLGFPIHIVGESILLLRLIGRKEKQLEQQLLEPYRRFGELVPSILTSFHPRLTVDGRRPRWRQAFLENAFPWSIVATLAAFAVSLSDSVGYRFAFAAFLILISQKALLAVRKRGKQTVNSD